MNGERMAAMADNVAKSVTAADSDEALVNVDGAVDAMIAAVTALEENLPLVKAETVPQKAAVAAAQQLLDEAIKPYLADIVKALGAFGE
jgi:hypothetical protein